MKTLSALILAMLPLPAFAQQSDYQQNYYQQQQLAVQREANRIVQEQLDDQRQHEQTPLERAMDNIRTNNGRGYGE